MSNKTSNTTCWYNDEEYSDLTLKLSDGREIKVHKLILCKRNEYFRALCGVNSNFVESHQNPIVLQEDDPDAVEEIIRKIYGYQLPTKNDKPWRFWFNLIYAANKYLESQLSVQANQRFRAVARAQTNSDEVFEIIRAIHTQTGLDQSLYEFAERLRRDNLCDLLCNEQYRALLDGDIALMWSQIDELRGIAACQEIHFLPRVPSNCRLWSPNPEDEECDQDSNASLGHTFLSGAFADTKTP